ncbi:hypothetical protein [Pedobacter polysacchareus]|uniref:hypothetical protein n=1 Tax=Pedobacter polysacchareus TaxID=2861973 RepID=UPI001C996DE9|nr:hypothetical protein [Pedobacter polysacchareus]
METLTKLPERALEYYINVRRWKTYLDFFNLEVVFLNRLMEEHFLQLSGEQRIKKLTQLGSKLSALVNEKHRIKGLLDQHLKNLELLAEDLLHVSLDELSEKQADLECRMTDLIHQYREVKRELYLIVEEILDERKLLVN